MGNDISILCNCTDNKTTNKHEHITKPINTSNLSETKANNSLHRSLERVKQKYDSNPKLTESSERFSKAKLQQPLATITDIEGYESNKNPVLNKKEQTITYDDGSVYTGYLVDGKRNGKGKLVNKDGSYEGEFRNDLKNGYGKIENSDYIYEGEWLNDIKSGQGTQILKNDGYKYIGQWSDDKKNGPGKEIFPDKSVYEAIFVNGKKNGKGKLYLCNGSIYDGEIQDDKLEGHGILKWSEDKIYEGQWYDNCLSGFGKFKNKNKLYKGYFERDNKHGYAINYDLSNNSFIIGHWEDNVLEGISIHISNTNTEQIWIMEKNRVKSKITEELELKDYRNSGEYRKLQDFYQLISSK